MNDSHINIVKYLFLTIKIIKDKEQKLSLHI